MRHLLKGIAKDAYNFIIGSEKLDTAADVAAVHQNLVGCQMCLPPRRGCQCSL